ncbi:MAG: hypothetical protein CME19_20755 [Gemmatimonadetes bacterium]|nr:hypothetical protein [Gemmatimonadota bacterium]
MRLAFLAGASLPIYLARMPALSPGDRFPDVVLTRSSDNRQAHLYGQIGGNPVQLIIVREFDGSDGLGESADYDVVRIVGSTAQPSPNVYVDPDGTTIDHHLSDAPSVCYLLDPNLRVIEVTGDSAELHPDQISVQHADTQGSIRHQAPVLMIDRVLEPDRCQFLQHLWEQDSRETGVEQQTSAGGREVISDHHKSRRDHTVQDPKLVQLLTQSIGKRVLPEIERAFIYRPARFEGFKIACYESTSSGFFHAHRDNLSPSTAHRRLAVSLNLNDGYAGGELRFPEFGRERYKPDAGSALVFSCAHLHEVLPVTEGRRFTLLTFLYDESVQRAMEVDPFAL